MEPERLPTVRSRLAAALSTDRQFDLDSVSAQRLSELADHAARSGFCGQRRRRRRRKTETETETSEIADAIGPANMGVLHDCSRIRTDSWSDSSYDDADVIGLISTTQDEHDEARLPQDHVREHDLGMPRETVPNEAPKYGQIHAWCSELDPPDSLTAVIPMEGLEAELDQTPAATQPGLPSLTNPVHNKTQGTSSPSQVVVTDGAWAQGCSPEDEEQYLFPPMELKGQLEPASAGDSVCVCMGHAMAPRRCDLGPMLAGVCRM